MTETLNLKKTLVVPFYYMKNRGVKMKKIVFLMLVMLSLFVTIKKDITASASESNLLNPVVKYEFKEGELGVAYK